MYRTITRTLLVLLAVAALPAGIEAYSRMVARPDPYMVTRATARWFDRHYKRNTRGFRADVDYANERAPNTRRIAFLGDSPTAGVGIDNVQERFTDRIQAALGPGWEVHNLGVPGTDTQDESTLIQQMLKRGYEVDEVVLVYSPDDLLVGVPVVAEGANRMHAYFATPGFWTGHSNWLETRALRRFVANDSLFAREDDFVRAAYGSFNLIAIQESRVARLQALLASKQIAFRVVTFPNLRALQSENFREIYPIIDRMWENAGVVHLDLFPVLAAHADRSLSIAPGDPNPNAYADSLAAAAILDFLPRARTLDSAGARPR